MAKLIDAIRQAVKENAETRYRIAKNSGVSAAQLSRLVSGEQGMSVETVEKLADYLGLEIIVRPKGKRKG